MFRKDKFYKYFTLICALAFLSACGKKEAKKAAEEAPKVCTNTCKSWEVRTDYPECKCQLPEYKLPDAKLQADLINAEYEGMLSGKLLSGRLLVDGQFGYRDNANATTSFIGDFDLKYLLYPNGNLAINFYNKTNDRYFTRNSLTTQGFGLLLKKDFSSLYDLFGRKRKKAAQKSRY